MFSQALVVVGVTELSAIDRPFRTTLARFGVVVLETANELIEVVLRVKLFVCSPEVVATMRRPERLLKICESAAHYNRVGLKHTPRYFIVNIGHRICVTIGEI